MLAETNLWTVTGVKGLVRHTVRRWISRYPAIYLPVTRPRHFDPLVDEKTDIVIDGFMRSANTFAVVAFQLAQNDHVRVAHHVHAAAHVIEAARLRKPTILTVRDPEPTILSNVVWDRSISVRQCLRLYAEFYERLLPYRDWFVVATFDEITSDFGAVIRRANERFGTSFAEFEHTEEARALCFQVIDERQTGPPWAPVARRFLAGEITADEYFDQTRPYRETGAARPNEARVPRPSRERDELKERSRSTYEHRSLGPLRSRAERAHEAFVGAARTRSRGRPTPARPSVAAPVFVIGSGRSGSTRLMDLIAYHPAFGWASQYNNRWPSLHQAAALSRVVDLPVLNSTVKFWKGVPKHDEAYALWCSIFPGFAEPFRDLVAADVTERVKRSFRRTIEDILRYQRKERFITKYTGWSRIEFLREIFPDAKFIHIVRDGRAVANSYVNVRWWQGYGGVYKWQWGTPSPELLEKVARYDNSFLALAAVNWMMLVDNIADKASRLPADDFLTVRYEDLVDDPGKEAERCIEFSGLASDPRFEKHLSTISIVDANHRPLRIPAWRENLTDEQIAMLEELLEDSLARFGSC